MFRGRSIAAGLAVAAFAPGCATELPGSFWDVTVTTPIADTCNSPQVDYTDTVDFAYRLLFDGPRVSLALGEDVFAAGGISGCDINYQSVVWGEPKDGYDLKWQITGEAIFRPGGSACDLDTNVDWLGTETFEIISSDHPDIAAGCTYSITLTGVFTGTVE